MVICHTDVGTLALSKAIIVLSSTLVNCKSSVCFHVFSCYPRRRFRHVDRICSIFCDRLIHRNVTFYLLHERSLRVHFTQVSALFLH